MNMFKLDIPEEDTYEQATIETIQIFENTHKMMLERYALMERLKDFNSYTLTMCRRTVEKAITAKIEGKFDRLKYTEDKKKLKKLLSKAENDNIEAQILRILADYENLKGVKNNGIYTK